MASFESEKHPATKKTDHGIYCDADWQDVFDNISCRTPVVTNDTVVGNEPTNKHKRRDYYVYN